MHSSLSATNKVENAQLSKTSFFICGVVLPVVVGVAIYVVFRDDKILFSKLLRLAGINQTFKIESSGSLALLLGSLPDGLWVFSFAYWLKLIWNRITLWMFLPIGLAIASEIGNFSKSSLEHSIFLISLRIQLRFFSLF